ncbi:MAG: pirin family protein [Sediminibacterium sp.]|jgi:quercetin 2,3-dioxygenase|uniref:pirin family protein n=1 Tax=Sediminibacterium sp. TaxID=1917865 RepID=UPI002AB928CA|nr:pirin family protein [Sediminibacterium sp.]MDZ4072914.1 pirin family protein [Sediminibacterium sp.]
MKTILHKANTRGHASFGWLNSYHTFSFGHYYNPERIHFGALRVLNDDTVKGGMGFSKHPHDNMEIVSIPLSGDLHHKDTTGRDEIIRQHDVQIMSAGSGIAHSETNANHDKEVKFLQIWVFPKEKNIEPRYQQKSFKPEDRLNQVLAVVAPDDEQAVWINQDAWFSLANLEAGIEKTYQIKRKENGVYAFVIGGQVTINGEQLDARDGLGIWETDTINITANNNAEILLIDVPMKVEEA